MSSEDVKTRYCRCIMHVAKQYPAYNPYAVCTSSVYAKHMGAKRKGNPQCSGSYKFEDFDVSELKGYASLKKLGTEAELDHMSKDQLVHLLYAYVAAGKGRKVWQEYLRDYRRRHQDLSAKKSIKAAAKEYHVGKNALIAKLENVPASKKRLPATHPGLGQIAQSVPSSRRRMKEVAEEEEPHKYEGRGAPTRGWKAEAPTRGKERHQLHAKCGEGCFLDPEHEKYPICSSLRANEDQCGVDCRGILSAKIRARQYGHEDVARKADKMAERYNCAWKKTPARKSPGKAPSRG